jgi:hypothetical protein
LVSARRHLLKKVERLRQQHQSLREAPSLGD